MKWINPDIKRGQQRDVALMVGEGGGIFALDRDTGQFLWANPFPFDTPDFLISKIDVKRGRRSSTKTRSPAVQVWLLLAVPTLGWGWLTWIAWVVRGLNITVVLVIAAAVSWLVSLLAIIPREASRRLVDDRVTGALEVVLCTSLGTKALLQGQWLSLARRYSLPVLAVMAAGAALMGSGYATFGFGGMLDPEDRALWLIAWLSGIVLLPLWLTALCFPLRPVPRYDYVLLWRTQPRGNMKQSPVWNVLSRSPGSTTVTDPSSTIIN